MGETNPLDRRSFIKNTAFGTLGVLNTLSCTNAKIVFEELADLDPSQKPIFIDLLRHEDLLNLKFHLYNVQQDSNKNFILNPNKQFYMFVELPSQHIAEELVTKLVKGENNPLNKRKKSFLAGSSWLVLRHDDREGNNNQQIIIDEEFLLDWENKFELVTLDNLENSNGNFSKLNLREKRELLCEIKGNTTKEINGPLTFRSNDFGFGNQYLSSFEVPYKMHLSPVSEAVDGYKFERYNGTYSFASNEKVQLLNIQEESDFYKLHEIWENRLQFKAIDGGIYAPRFKVVQYKGIEDYDRINEQGCPIELLPKPTHRRELHELTMLPFNKRDVVSNFFKFSAFGASTKLKYENDQPIENTTIVSWKQHIKYARDNYVSITFRAIDVFTGLKLLVSIVAERKFQEGKSFLYQRYYISYLEPEKIYEDPVVIGKMTFSKIIALTKGAYFIPIPLKQKTSYHVQRENTSKFKPEFDLNFKYKGIDKRGKEHIFFSKIIFIPAEKYVIESGVYGTTKNKQCREYSFSYVEDETVPIKDIGGLNPYCQVAIDSSDEDCFKKGDCNEGYTYSIERNFSKSENVRNILKNIRDTINGNKKLLKHYSIQINAEMSYADISSLQQEINGEYLVNPKSDNATFKTQNIFLFTTLPEEEVKVDTIPEDYRELDCCENDVTDDPFSTKYPLIPFLHHAEVVIPQISQIEGVDVYRNVALTNSFWKWPKKKDSVNEEKEILRTIDFAPNSTNKFQLLFALVEENPAIQENPSLILRKPLKGFFNDNYRNSGGVANPGITIKNVSVLDNGITYSENPQIGELNKINYGVDVGIESSIDTNSIFEALEAEICGINLLDIVEMALPLEDIPVFNFIKDADETFDKIKDKYESLKYIYNQWQGEFTNLNESLLDAKSNLKEAEQDIQQYLRQLIREEASGLLGKINSLVEQSNSLSKLQVAIGQFESAIPDKGQIKKEYERLESKISTLIGANDVNHIENLNEAFNEINLLEFYPRFLTKQQEKEAESKVKKLVENIEAIIHALSKVEVDFNDLINYFFLRVLFELIKTSDLQILDILNHEDKLNVELFIEEFIKLKEDINSKAIGLNVSQRKQLLGNYSAVLKGLEKVSRHSQELNRINIERARCELERKLKKIVEKEGAKLAELFEIENKKVSVFLENINRVKLFFKKYEFYRIRYNEFFEDFILFEEDLKLNYEDLCDTLINDLDTIIESFPNEKIREVLSEIRDLVAEAEINIFSEYNKFIEEKKNSFLEEYLRIENKILNDISEGALIFLKYEKAFNNQLDEAKTKARKFEKEIKEKEKEIKGFFDKKKEELDAEYERQLEILKNDPRVLEAQKFVNEYKEFKQKLLEATNQSLNYTFKTKKFRNADLGVISFAANQNTELSVKVDYSLQFQIEEFDRPPTLIKQSYLTDTTFKEFQVSFLKLINIDFEKIQFISGSDVKDDFKVKIRDVQFGGCLSFVDAIQEYLNGISENLIFEVSSKGAMVNYILPPFTIEAPPFKFFNISFSALLLLPFDPKKSLQLKFGLGSELNKFGLIYLAFGGQGYFNIIVEPKQGIVGLEVVLEFGAIYHADIGGVAKGVAYLVGGIYIKRYYGNYQIKAYILCVGRFSILGIFSASASFYLGLEGDGNQLDGVCIITFTKRFSRFFKIKVKVSMKKTIYGTNKQGGSNNNPELDSAIMAYGFELVDTNISEIMVEGEKPFITLSYNKKYKKAPPKISYDGVDFIPIPLNEKSRKSNSEIVELVMKKEVGTIDHLKFNNELIVFQESESTVKNEEMKKNAIKNQRPSDIEYYKSLFV